MKGVAPARDSRGFTILEMLIAMAIFLAICAAMFGLLQLSQQKYASESELSASFQEARLAMDQIVRDINVAGYPSLGLYSVLPTDPSSYAVGPVAWYPNYYPLAGGCAIETGGGTGCATPGDFDLIVETRLGNDTSVSWVRYYLNGTTLYRAVAQKTSDSDPRTPLMAAGVAVPFLVNVMNNAPGQLPGGVPVPIFQYTCNTPAGPTGNPPQPLPCPAAGVLYDLPQNVRDVDVTLIVATPQADRQTHAVKLVELNGSGHTWNGSH